MKINEKNIEDQHKRHQMDLESIQYEFEAQLKYSQWEDEREYTFSKHPAGKGQGNVFNANECKEQINRMRDEIETKEHQISKLKHDIDHLRLNWEPRISGTLFIIRLWGFWEG